MNTMVKLPAGGFRDNTAIQALLDETMSRHFSKKEQEQYLSVLPAETARVQAAREVMAVEKDVVARTVAEVLSIYPFKQFHEAGPEKCARDITFVSVYAVNAMLCNDMEWYKDKFLYWMRTMIMSFCFPSNKEDGVSAEAELGLVANPFPDITRAAESYPAGAQAIFDTYSRLARHFKEELSPEAWQLMEEPLQTAIDVLVPSEQA